MPSLADQIAPWCVAALAVAGAAASAYLMWWRVPRLERAHNQLVRVIERERSGTAALLEAAGLPGGRAVGRLLDSLPAHEGRDPRSRGRRTAEEPEPAADQASTRFRDRRTRREADSDD